MIMTIIDVAILVLSFGLLHKSKQIISQLGFRVLIAMVFGVGYGLLLKLAQTHFLLAGIKDILYLIGYGYLALLKMLVIPLILTSITYAILNLGSTEQHSIKKIGLFATAMLLVMTAISSLIGILIGQWFEVGKGLSLPHSIEIPNHEYTGLVKTLLNMLPANPIASMTQENTIAIVLFAVLLGIAAHRLDEKDRDKMLVFKNMIAALFAIVKKLATLVLSLTPYGILALMALLILEQGTSLLGGILNFIIAMYVAMALVIFMHTMVLILFNHHPWNYFKKAYAPLFVAFTTRSSFGTLPVTEETLRDKFKTSQAVATFVPSIGTTIGMNACAGIFPAMLVVMTLTILHQPLTPYLILMVMFINAVASLGISGIPGTAYIAATVTLTSLNLPYAVVALVQGIDPLIDMGRTATNVNGVLTTALVTEQIQQKNKESIDTILAKDNLKA